MRFLHTSDWHLGRLFHGVHLTDEQAYLLDELVKAAKDSKVDAVLIAGDIYDRSVPPTEAVKLLDETLQRLIQDVQTNVIFIAGNHDNAQRLGFGQRLFAANKLYITGPLTPTVAPVILYDNYGPVYFSPITYCEPLAATEILKIPLKTHEELLRAQIADQLAQIPASARRVALAHVFLTGGSESPESERPLSIGGASTVPAECFDAYNYAALGHLHACQAGNAKTRYSGSLMKYSFNEVNQRKGFNLVDLAADGSISIETVPLQPRIDLACLQGSFDELLQNPVIENQQDYLQIILTDEHPILDAKYRLEQVYPNILRLEYARLNRAATATTPARHEKLGIKELYTTFFEQVTRRPLTTEEATALTQTLTADFLKEDEA